MRAVEIFLGLPYRLLLLALGPCRTHPPIRRFARRCVGPFMWLNTLWVTMPSLLIEYLVRDGVSWPWAIASFLVAALILNSAVAHATEGVLREWDADTGNSVRE